MNRIEGILERLPGLSEDARYESWLELVSGGGAKARAVFADAIAKASPLVKLLYVRFLGQWREEPALEALCGLFLDANPTVVAACRKAYDRHPDPRKWARLLPVLDAPTPEARHYAIDRLGQGSVMQAVMPLVKILRSAETETAERVLAALRFLPEKILLGEIPPYLNHGTDGVRFRAVLILAELHEEGYGGARSHLARALKNDPAPRVRQAAAWGLRRRKSRRDVPIYEERSLHDPDPMVRQECLVALGAVPSSRVIAHLLGVLVRETDRMVILKGEGVLLSLPKRKIVKALGRIYKNPDRALRVKALLLFAELQEESKPFYRYLFKELARARRDGEKLPFIEAIGILRRREALPALEGLLGASPLVTYAAMAAIIKIWGHDSGFPAGRYLSDPGLSPLIKQMVLKHFLRNEASRVDEPGLVENFIAFVASDNLNLRYLSAMALARLPGATSLEPLLGMLLSETDASSLKLLRECVSRIFAAEPGSFAAAFEKRGHDPEAVTLLLSYLGEARLPAEKIAEVFRVLCARPLEGVLAVNGEAVAEALFRFVLQRALTLGQALEILGGSPQGPRIAALLAERLKRNPALRVCAPVGSLVEGFRAGAPFARADVLEFLGRNESSEAVTALTAIIARPEYADYHVQAASGLRRLTGFAP